MDTKASFAYFTPDCSCLGIVGECFDGWNPWSEAVAGLLIQCFLDLRIFVWLLGKGGVERRELNLIDRLQQTATDCNRLQQTATDCNRLQQTARLNLIFTSLDGACVEKITRKPYCVCRP